MRWIELGFGNDAPCMARYAFLRLFECAAVEWLLL